MWNSLAARGKKSATAGLPASNPLGCGGPDDRLVIPAGWYLAGFTWPVDHSAPAGGYHPHALTDWTPRLDFDSGTTTHQGVIFRRRGAIMRALVTGATGFIGQRLIRELDHPIVLTRNPDKAEGLLGKVEAIAWDPNTGPPPARAFEGVDTIFHLAGESVAEGRWWRAKKERIRNSREIGTRNLVVGIERCSQRPQVLVSASAVGYYGARGETVLDETAASADDFLGRVCLIWEREAQRAANLGLRVVNPRIGIVLGEQGGALAKMLPLFKWGLGGRLGDGRQWMSWVHVDDVVGMMRYAVDQASISGPMNAVAPNPVTNREFTRVLAGVLGRPAFLPAPALGLRLGLGEFADVLLASQRVVPRVALEAGYHFRYADLDSALQAAISGAASSAEPAHAQAH